jgi:hypothetical protein
MAPEISRALSEPLGVCEWPYSDVNTPPYANPYYTYHSTRCEIELTQKTEDFASTFSFVKFGKKRHAALVAYRELNVDMACIRRSSPYGDVETQCFEVGVVFYIMYPKYDVLTEGYTTTYWDIHSERESDQEEINHNRELDLEEYVSAILQEIKEIPDNYSSGMYQVLKTKNYDMTTGFVKGLH